MENFVYKKHYNNKSKSIQRKLNKRIKITIAFQPQANWCELDECHKISIRIKEEQKRQMKKI